MIMMIKVFIKADKMKSLYFDPMNFFTKICVYTGENTNYGRKE